MAARFAHSGPSKRVGPVKFTELQVALRPLGWNGNLHGALLQLHINGFLNQMIRTSHKMTMVVDFVGLVIQTGRPYRKMTMVKASCQMEARAVEDFSYSAHADAMFQRLMLEKLACGVSL